MKSDIVISVKKLSKSYRLYDRPQDRLKQGLFRGSKQYYREFWALRDITFEVRKGETIGIIGRNGSGKSTLLQIIAGTLRPTAGEVQVNGRVAALLELGSGFNPEFTGRENVYLNGAIFGLSRQEMDKRFDTIAAFAEVGDFIDQPLKTYSSGMAVRLAFAVQVMIPKDVLIVDEALAVGDELFQRKCYAKIEEFKKQGGTILFVSHSGAAIVELCDRAILMDAGECLLIGSSKKVVNLYQKLIYAPASKKEEIRREITEISKAILHNQDEKELGQVEKSTRDRGMNWSQESMFDPNLVPKESLRYENRGAEIFDPEILTLGGRKVNVLITGEKYIWRYYVKFSNFFQGVRFGMLIKTASGLELGGAVSALPGQGLSFVEPGTIFKVEFSFIPRLNTGVYFLNAGVLGLSGNGEGEIFLDRAVDVGAFRVLSNEDSLITVIVDFSVTSKIVKVDGESLVERGIR